MGEPDADEALLQTMIEVGRYRLRTEAQDRALVVLAMGLECKVEHSNEGYSLLVNEPDLQQTIAELARFEKEKTLPAGTPEYERHRVSSFSFFLCTWLLSVLFLMQKSGPEWMVEAGSSSSRDIIFGHEWWRIFTGLTLHADLPHLGMNLATGMLFCWFLMAYTGTGVGWFLVLLSGGLGNLINAWCYRHVEHGSIGGSTAVFGALGLLVACQIGWRFMHKGSLNFREIFVPLGAAAAFLAFMGVGDPESPANTTDYLAHLWGLCAGILCGGIAELGRWTQIGKIGQRLCGLLCLGLIGLAWVLVVLNG